MIRIIKELNIDVTKPNVFQAVVAKQYDANSRFLKVTFTDCGNRIDIPKADTNKVIINAERADGKSDGFYGEINDDGTVTVPLHSWILEKEGTVNCDISVLCDNDKKLTTTSFALLVEKAAYGGEDITSDPQYDVLMDLIEKAGGAGGGTGGGVSEELVVQKIADAFAEVAIATYTSPDSTDYTVIDRSLLMGNDIYMGNMSIYDLNDPINEQDAVNKRYVDGKIGDIETALDSIIEIQNGLMGSTETVETITFTLKLGDSGNDTTCSAQSGMTWGEWLDSEYNSINAQVDTDMGVIYGDFVDETGEILEGMVIVGADGETPVTLTETIVSGMVYYMV